MTKELPTPFQPLLMLIDGGELGPIPAVGYGAKDDGDSGTMIFMCTVGHVAYPPELILDWKYLDKVCPEYILPESAKFLEEPTTE